MRIKTVEVENFKSFRSEKFELSDGLTVVTGPNGSGKSNLFDAIVFALGNTSSKTLRYKNINELIHKGEKSDFAKVKIIFDNGTHIERYVADGSSTFRLNSKRTTKDAIVTYLKEKMISDSGHNIVFQDDVKKIIEMSEVDRRKLVEEIANVLVFDEQKNKAQRNLELIYDKIQKTKLILDEREGYLTKLKEEKEQAEKYLRLEGEKILFEGGLLKSERKQLDKDLNSLTTRRQNTKESIERNKDKLKDIFEKIDKYKSKISCVQQDIDGIKDEVQKLKSSVSLEEYKRDELERKINKMKNEIDSNNLNDIKLKINDTSKEIINLDKEIEEINAKLKSKKSSNTQEEIISLQKDIENNKEIESKIKEFNDKLELLKSKKREIEYQNKLAKDVRESNKNLKQEINELKGKKSSIKLDESYVLKLEDKREILNKKFLDYRDKREKLIVDIKLLEDKLIETKTNISALSSIEFSLLEPISVRDKLEAEKFAKEREEKSKFGTYVFFVGSKKDESNIKIINVTPENKIKNLKLLQSDYDTKLNRLSKREEDIKASIEKTEKEIKEIDNLTNAEREKINASKREAQSIDDKIQYLRSKISLEPKSYDYKAIQTNIQEIQKNIDSLKSKINTKSYDVLTQKLSINEEINNLRDSINTKKISLSELKSHKNTLDEKLNDSKRKNKELEKEINDTKTKLNLTISNSTRYNKMLSKTKMELQKLEDKKSDILSELSHSKKLRDELNSRIIKDESDIENIANNIAIKKSSIDERDEDIARYIASTKNKDVDLFKLEEYESKKISELRDGFYSVEQKLTEMGEVNLKSIKDYNEMSESFNQINSKLKILEEERSEVSEELGSIKSKKKDIFMKYFSKIKTNFTRISKEFGLGNLDFILTDSNIDNAGIKIVLKKGTYTRPLSSLSGGEKSLTTIAFILSVVEFESAPFYLFDEIDAALDYKNTEKVIEYIKKLAKTSQVIMVSHNPESVDSAEYLIGISKNRLGITTVGIKQTN